MAKPKLVPAVTQDTLASDGAVDAANTPASTRTTIEPMAEAMLLRLRLMDAHIRAIHEKRQEAVAGYIAGRGLNADTHAIDFDIGEGVVRITPK